MGAGQLECLLQIKEDCDGGVAIDMILEGHDTVRGVHSPVEVSKMCGWRGPMHHWIWVSSILSAVLAEMLIKEMDHSLVGFLGLGMG